MQRRPKLAPAQRFDPYPRSSGRASSLHDSYPRGPPASSPPPVPTLTLAQAAQFAAFLTASGYDPSYVAAASATAQAMVFQQQQQLQLQQQQLLLLQQRPPVVAEVGPLDDLEPGQYKVRKDSQCRAVAGKVASDIRLGVSPSLVARGDAVAVAIKSIALGCTFLSGNGVMLTCSPSHKNDGDNETGRTVILELKSIPLETLELGTHQIKVAKKSRVEGIAGSIAHTLRKGEAVSMQALGPECIGHAIDALAVARRMLRADSLDVCFTPKFISLESSDKHTQVGDKKPSAIQFHLFPIKL